MKKKSASQSAFFNLRVLIGLFIVLAGVFLALAGLGTFSAITANSVQAQQKHKIIDLKGLPPGFDCATIYEKGIHKMEGFRAGLIMIACGESQGGSTSPLAAVDKAIQKVLPPAAFGAGDVDVVTGADTPPHIIQSETFTTANPDNPDHVVVCFNDSRGAASSNFSGCSVSTDGGTTFTRLTTGGGQSPFTNTFGDPVVLYNQPTGTWFTVWLDANGSCTLGGYKSTTPWDPNSWTHFCVHTNGGDDRESGYADNDPGSPHFGNMYVSWNDFNIGGGALFVAVSTDNGATWTPHQVTPSFVRDVQITADEVTGYVYIAGMDEGGGGLTGPRTNKIYRSTDGGTNWTNTFTSASFPGPGNSLCFSNSYFAAMFDGGFWRHMGWGQPGAHNHVVHYVYAQCGGPSPCSSATDHGDVYYIRSTNDGVNFSAPLKLNTDGTTATQWQPNLSVSPAGTVFAMWYDTRTGGNCNTPGGTLGCYQMFGRKSPDNGVSWLPADTLSDVVSPLVGQADPNIVGCYAGDYDYGSSILTKHVTSWVDGRVLIGGQSQQDVFTDRELVGFAVTTTDPACNRTVNTQPVDFIVNLSDPASLPSVQATDFTVNGTPANSFVLSNGNATITFHFNSSPVVTQGLQTMHIPAGAILRASDNDPIFEFNCTFCYAITPLQVTSTDPPVGGTFSPPAPGDYQYDVNFNQAVDPASVQTSDLTLTMGSVTAVSVVNGNTTARFTVHFDFGGSVTANIGAGAITAVGCNPNAAFTGNYTVEGCPPPNHYEIAQIGGSIVPGTMDIGNHCDDCTTTIALPFSYTLYDQTFNAVNLSSNGNAQFTTTITAFINVCLPWVNQNYTIFPYWDNLLTSGGNGIFTSTTGTAPNRIFNIEWRVPYHGGGGTANFELRLYEGQSRFDVIYGAVSQGNTSATAGVQRSTDFDEYFCNGSGGAATGGQSYILQSCGTPTPTPTATPGQITLRARAQTQGNNHRVQLRWSPADGGSMNVLRNGAVVQTTADDGKTNDNLGTQTGTFTYQVCETDTGDCSNEVIVQVP